MTIRKRMTGKRVSHYEILQKLGEGGMGVVWKAHDMQLDRGVALKLLPSDAVTDSAARPALLREARMASKLNHPHICTIYEVGESGGQVFIAMELVEGQSLSARLAAGRLPVQEVLRLGIQLSDALAHAHDRGVIHRDFKSANIVITAGGCAKVLDFGLARRLPAGESTDAERRTETTTDTVTRPGMVMGTLAYMAPEQLRGQPADARSDLWALGIVLHEMASGTRPFQGTTTFDISSAILKDAPPPLPADVRPELQAVIVKCLDKQPEYRYQRASELRTALEVLQSGSFMLPPAPRRFTRRWVFAAVLAAVAVAAGTFAFRTWGGAGRKAVESVAVLPFENLSRDPGQDYLVDGIHEAMITDMAKLGGFKKVIARPSVQRYRHSEKRLPQIARELGVDAVMTGSVLRSGDRVSITAQLIKASTEENLWADRYESEFRDVLALENEIVSAIAREIKARLSPEQERQLAARRKVNPESHEAYLRGMFHLNKFTPDEFTRGVNYLQQAVERDPENALAYGALALAFSLDNPAEPQDAVAKAKEAALKALELDPALSEAHAALAQIKIYLDRDYDWPGAEKLFRRAIQLNPSLAAAHAHWGWQLLLFGRRDEGIAEMKRAVELDPLNPLYPGYLACNLTGAWYPIHSEAEFSHGMDLLRKTLELDPNFPPTWAGLGWAYAVKNMYKESVEAHQKAKAMDPAWGWGLAVANARMGRTEEARKHAADLAGQGKAWNTFGIAEIYAALGDKKEALRWLEAAYAQRQPFIPWVRVNTSFAGLHGDPAFEDLLRRMKLPKSF